MKVAFGTVIYEEAFDYVTEFIKSLNEQVNDEFNILLLNDNLSADKINYIENNLKKIPIIWKGKEDSKPYELRADLISKAKIENYDLLILGDFDDTFSDDRISSIINEYDKTYAFFYNELYYHDKKFFKKLPDETINIVDIMESNYIGLSNSALNLNSLNEEMINDLFSCKSLVFDWYLYSLLLIHGLKGKKIKSGKTYYRIHGSNIAGEKQYTMKSVIKEIDIKIDHYYSLKHISNKLEEKLYYYERLKTSINNAEIDIFRYFNNENDYWWGLLNSKKMEWNDNMVKFDYNKIKNYARPYIIAEIGANHNGDMNLAKKMIDEAANCGIDAVKFQSWTNKSIIAKSEYDKNQKYDDSSKKHFGSLEEMVEKYYLREEHHFLLKEYCVLKGVTFCSTPFTEQEVDLLDRVGVPFYKVASMDINNLRLLEYIANKGKPIILSTGMSTLSEIETAVNTIEAAGNFEIIILHCISIYPPEAKDIHLKNIILLQKIFSKYPIGFSDHTIGTSVPIASVALGAAVLEKHFTTDKGLPGWDHEVSADPQEMHYIVAQSQIVSEALGNFHRTVSEAEENKKVKFRRSIILTRDMSKGEIIKNTDITFKRPGTHISPDQEKYVVGRTLGRDMKQEDLLDWRDLL